MVGGRFEIVGLAGAGGMGTVYRARDLATGDSAALKVLHLFDRDSQARFDREAHLLSTIRHPGVVALRGYGAEPDGLRFLAMEWVEGRTLDTRLRSDRLDTAQALMLVKELAGALAAVHRAGIVHRDVKPANIMLRDDDLGRPVLVDFGVARASIDHTPLTATGAVVGTPVYMAPEQCRGERSTGPACDVYAVGCVLFECLVGHAPSEAPTAVAAMAKTLFEDTPRLSAARPEVPAALDELVTRLLAKEAGERPADGHALLAELTSLARRLDHSPKRRGVQPLLTAGEQRLVAVVFLAVPEPVTQTGAALPMPDSPTMRIPARIPMAAAQAISAPFGAEIAVFPDGSLTAIFRSSGIATDMVGRAVRCALSLNEEFPGHTAVVATGRALLHRQAAVGEAIDRAVTMAAMGLPAATSGVLVDEVTAGLLDPGFNVRSQDGALFVRRERPGARTFLRRPTPCVGRERELAFFDSLLHESVGDRVARAVLVTGPPGVGKSRLRTELLASLADLVPPCTVGLGRGDPIRSGSPLRLLGEVVRSIVQGGAEELTRALAAARLPAGAAAHTVDFLCELAGVTPEQPISAPFRVARRESTLMSDQLLATWLEWLAHEAHQRSVVLVLDDLQWGDHATVHYLDVALRQLADLPLLIIAFARPDVRDAFPSLWQDRAVHQLPLSGLSRRASERLVRHALGEDVEPVLVERLVAQASGNAFFLEELVRAAAEGQIDRPPRTVIAMAAARLDALPDWSRRVLRAASIFGRAFVAEGIAALVGSSAQPAVADALAELAHDEVITRSAQPSEHGPVYVFRHALLREAAYASLTPEDLRLGHRLAASWLLKNGETDPVAMAVHLELGGEPLVAGEWWARAAEAALDVHDVARVAEAVERGMAGKPSGPLRGRLLAVRAVAELLAGEVGAARSAAEEACALLPHAQVAWFAAFETLLAAMTRQADRDGMLQALDRLYEAGSAAGADRVAYRIAAARSVPGLYYMGLIEQVNEIVAEARSWLQEDLEFDPALEAAAHRALEFQASYEGDLGASMRHCAKSMRAFSLAGDIRNRLNETVNLGFGLQTLGDFDKAEALLREAVQEASRLGLRNMIAMGQQNLANALAYQGRFEDAIRAAEQSLELSAAAGDRVREAATRASLAMILWRAGRFAEAASEARAGMLVAEQAPPYRCYCQAALALALLGEDRDSQALVEARAAMEILEQLPGLDEGEHVVRVAFVESLLAAGSEEEALGAVTSCARWLQRMVDRVGGSKVREMYLRVPEHRRLSRLAYVLAGIDVR